MDLRKTLVRLSGGRCGSLLRSLIRRICGRMRIRRRLPGSVGGLPLYVSPAATLEYLLPGRYCFDPELLTAAEHFVMKGDCIWDVGANLGVFSLAAAWRSAGGKVVAFEADPWLASLIRDSLQLPLNRGRPVSVICAAVGEKTGVSRFCVARNGRASSYLESCVGRSTAGGVDYVLEVLTMSLDRLLDEMDPPDFVKIDVEGAETSVLRGAVRMLKEIRPTLYIEAGAGQQQAVTAILAEAGYKLFKVNSGRPERVDQCGLNTLAVHESKIAARMPGTGQERKT